MALIIIIIIIITEQRQAPATQLTISLFAHAGPPGGVQGKMHHASNYYYPKDAFTSTTRYMGAGRENAVLRVHAHRRTHTGASTHTSEIEVDLQPRYSLARTTSHIYSVLAT